MKQQSGFTLIELIVVIVILGVLAATALPQFINLQDAAEESAVEGVAGALGAASALNHAANIAADAGVDGAPTPTATTECDDVGPLLDGGLPDDYAITVAAIGAAEGDSADCTVFFDNDDDDTADAGEATATFRAYNVQ